MKPISVQLDEEDILSFIQGDNGHYVFVIHPVHMEPTQYQASQYQASNSIHLYSEELQTFFQFVARIQKLIPIL
jgi:hypothetical protein